MAENVCTACPEDGGRGEATGPIKSRWKMIDLLLWYLVCIKSKWLERAFRHSRAYNSYRLSELVIDISSICFFIGLTHTVDTLDANYKICYIHPKTVKALSISPTTACFPRSSRLSDFIGKTEFCNKYSVFELCEYSGLPSLGKVLNSICSRRSSKVNKWFKV